MKIDMATKKEQPTPDQIRRVINILIADIQMLQAVMSPMEKTAEELSVDIITSTSKAIRKLIKHLE